MKDPEKRRLLPKNYTVTEQDILKISILFGHLEEAVKEILRTQHNHHPCTRHQEESFYTERGRILYEHNTDISHF
jgi:hypothetical protein